MYQEDTDLLFPARVIAELSELRQAGWQGLIARVAAAGPDSSEETAFVLMMVRLNGCGSCNTDSYRAMQGCNACSRQTLKRFRGSDEELANLFDTAHFEVQEHLKKKGKIS